MSASLAATLAVVTALWAAGPTPRGARAWSAVLPGAPARGCAVDEAHVYQGVARGKGGLVAVSRKTGRVAWRRWHGRRGVAAAPRVVGAHVVHGSFSGDVVAYERATGKPRWRYASGGGLMSTPVPDGARLWLGFIGGVAAVDPETGAERLRVPFPAAAKVLGVADGHVFIYSAGGNEIVALDAATGEVAWRVGGPVIDRARGIAAGFQPERVVLDGERLFVPTNVAETWSLDVRTGRRRWGYEPEGMTFGLASVADTLVLTSTAGAPGKGWQAHVARIEKATGLVVWKRPLGATQVAIPLVVGDAILVPTSQRGLVAVGRGDGEPLFRVPLRGAAWWSACASEDGVVYVGHDKRRLTAIR